MPHISNDTLNLFDYAKQLRNGTFHFRYDPETQLHAIITIDSLKLGPALGGCRFVHYASFHDALRDSIRLARGMTLKSAISDLGLGGGKSIIMRPSSQVSDREALFSAFGRFVHELGGHYITANDSGTTTPDMMTIAKETPYVVGLPSLKNFPTGTPSPFTAIGVYQGIKAAVHHYLKREELTDLHVAIQGVGNVGYPLAKLLHKQGVKLTVTDFDPKSIEKCVNEFNATPCDLDAIYDVECDIFAPCALGGILNQQTIPKLKAKIVAGSANNQLNQFEDGQLLFKRGILYAPDYVINSGGLIYAAAEYMRTNEGAALEKVNKIYDLLTEIFRRSDNEKKSPHIIADALAHEKLNAV